MRFKHTNRPGFWLGFIDFFTAGLFFLLYMPFGGLQDELEEILGHKVMPYWPFVIWVLVAVPWGILISRYYFGHVKYICPECHEIFKPTLKEAFWANHTPTARKLTCTACGHKGFCVEVWGGDGQ